MFLHGYHYNDLYIEGCRIGLFKGLDDGWIDGGIDFCKMCTMFLQLAEFLIANQKLSLPDEFMHEQAACWARQFPCIHLAQKHI